LKVTIFVYFNAMKNALLLSLFALLLAGTGLAQAPHADTTKGSRSAGDTVTAAAITGKPPIAASDSTTKAGTTKAAAGDDGMDMFLLFYAIAFVGIAFAAVFVGAAIMVGFLLVLFALVSAGVLSTGVLVGMYRRSVAAGFRTLLVIVCGLAGLFTGAVGLWLIGRIFTLHWKAQSALLTGALGGLAGGIILGLILFFIFNSFFRFCKRRLAL
jgi:hypothetical protein